ncbi:MAG: hypothetical protein ACR2ND_07265, partial [Solirubrobacteraceae bacterium]
MKAAPMIGHRRWPLNEAKGSLSHDFVQKRDRMSGCGRALSPDDMALNYLGLSLPMSGFPRG